MHAYMCIYLFIYVQQVLNFRVIPLILASVFLSFMCFNSTCTESFRMN